MSRHEDFLIDIVDRLGGMTGQKRRAEIDKSTDLCHGVYVLVMTPDMQPILSKIPHRIDLPNLHAGTLGATVATMRRHCETADQAAQRALAREVSITNVRPVHKHDHFIEFPGGRKAYIGIYFAVHALPDSFSMTDIQDLIVLSPKELDRQMADAPETIAPTLAFIWRKYANNFRPSPTR